MKTSLMHFLRTVFTAIWHIPRTILIALIGVYQRTISPDHSPAKHTIKIILTGGRVANPFPHGFCKFAPSCSQYTKERLREDGVVVGLAKGMWQVLRCNPWSKGNRVG